MLATSPPPVLASEKFVKLFLEATIADSRRHRDFDSAEDIPDGVHSRCVGDQLGSDKDKGLLRLLLCDNDS